MPFTVLVVALPRLLPSLHPPPGTVPDVVISFKLPTNVPPAPFTTAVPLSESDSDLLFRSLLLLSSRCSPFAEQSVPPVAAGVSNFPFATTNGVAGADLLFSCCSIGTRLLLLPNDDGGLIMPVRFVVPFKPFSFVTTPPFDADVRFGMLLLGFVAPLGADIRSPFVSVRAVGEGNVPMCVVRTGLLVAPPPGDRSLAVCKPNELRLWLEPTDVRRSAGTAGPLWVVVWVGVVGALVPAILCLTEDSWV